MASRSRLSRTLSRVRLRMPAVFQLARLEVSPAVHRVEGADGLHHGERLLAVVERGRPGLRPEVDLVIPVRLVPDGLVAHERAVDAGRAAVHESRAHVAAGDEDRALPVHGAVILQISILDDENAGTLDLAVDGEAGEVRAGVELASEVHELRVAWRSQVERLTQAAAVGQRRRRGGGCAAAGDR